jgi:hypothetical protein
MRKQKNTIFNLHRMISLRIMVFFFLRNKTTENNLIKHNKNNINTMIKNTLKTLKNNDKPSKNNQIS